MRLPPAYMSYGPPTRGDRYGYVPEYAGAPPYMMAPYGQGYGPLKGGGVRRGNGGYHNVHNEDASKYDVVLENVLDGRDKRTTLMIKNIPNKYTQAMLLEKLDEKYHRQYDFFYLPIDFKNKCNVGYAFINFIDPSSIAHFYQDFNQRKWDRFNSEKVCRLAYARIQGKTAFIEHFRNSSLMYEDESCRPLIFHSSGPLKGLLQAFPEPTVPRVPPGSHDGNDDVPIIGQPYHSQHLPPHHRVPHPPVDDAEAEPDEF